MADSVKDRSVLRAAGAMGVATFLSRILGLVREQVFAYFFGAGLAMDAYNIAFRIPNLLRDLFAEGAMSAALVPTFTRERMEQGDRRAWRLAGLVFRVLTLVVACIAVVGIIFSPQLVTLYAGAFKSVPGKFELTVRMTRMMFPFFPLVALAAACMGILNACGKFFLPAFASALFNVGSIVSGVALVVLFRQHPEWGWWPIEGMAIGVVIGGALQAFSQWPTLRGVGYRYPAREKTDSVWHQDPGLKRMLYLMLPGTIGMAATQVNILVNSMLATSQGTGAVSWLNYSFRLVQFPIGIFGVSLASATLARSSKLWVEKDYSGLEQTVVRSLKQVFAINLAAAAGLAFLSEPIIQLIFEHGRFTAHDREQTAYALAAYSVGLVSYSALKVLVGVFYSVGNTRIPVISSALTVVLNLVSNLLLVRVLGHVGLALGTALASIFNALFLIYALRRFLVEQGGNFRVAGLFKAFWSYFFIALVMGGVCFVTARAWTLESLNFLEPFLRVPGVRALRVIALMIEGGVVLLLLARVFQLRELLDVLELFYGKLKKKLATKTN